MSVPQVPGILVTHRLMMRPSTPQDAVDMFPIFSDPKTMRWWSQGPFKNIPSLADWLAPDPEHLAWTICWGGEPIGRVTLCRRHPQVAELGYLLGRDHWGQGLAREAIVAVIDHAFGPMALRRIYADSDPDNGGSIGVLASLGFTLEGRLREEWETQMGVRDSLIFGLLRREWHARTD